jgi:hypothetical protein
MERVREAAVIKLLNLQPVLPPVVLINILSIDHDLGIKMKREHNRNLFKMSSLEKH